MNKEEGVELINPDPGDTITLSGGAVEAQKHQESIGEILAQVLPMPGMLVARTGESRRQRRAKIAKDKKPGGLTTAEKAARRREKRRKKRSRSK